MSRFFGPGSIYSLANEYLNVFLFSIAQFAGEPQGKRVSNHSYETAKKFDECHDCHGLPVGHTGDGDVLIML